LSFAEGWCGDDFGPVPQSILEIGRKPMPLSRSSVVLRTLGVGAAVVALALVLTAPASAATFNANPASLGTIPDSPAGGSECGEYTAAPLDVTFNVASLSPGAPVDVALGFTLETVSSLSSPGPGHPWAGDLEVTLIAPNGAAKSILKQTGGTPGAPCGSSANLVGPYVFSDNAPEAPTWWAAAAAASPAATSATPIPSGSYRASTPGGATGGGANTLITPAFSGLSTLNATWTLRFRDGGEGDVAKVSAATLSIVPTPPPLLTVAKSGTGQGTVVGSGIDCGLDCTQGFEKGTTVPLFAVPATGSTFAGWTGCDAAAGIECTVAMAGARTVSAKFDAVAGGGAQALVPPASAKKKCRKGKKLKHGKCVKKKHHKQHKKNA